MNAGKSTALLQADHNYTERGMRTLLYTAQLDSRGGGRIHSRIGIQISGIGAKSPERRPDLMALGFRAQLAATLASCMCGAIVGIVA